MPLHAATVLLSALLLFEVQPLIGRALLPWFGGTSSVWTTCMLFFQVLLLGGYALADAIARRASPRAQGRLHLLLLGAGVLSLAAQALRWGGPLLPGPSLRPLDSSAPTLRLLAILLVTVGLPYLGLAATGPLVQFFFARRHAGRSPYRLYALSNAGSLLALLGHPLLLERLLPVRIQAAAWSAGFVLLTLLAIGIAQQGSTAEPALPAPVPLAPARARLTWVALAFFPSLLLLAVTNQICQEVAVTPLLWVVPLALYLVSFIVCFESERLRSAGFWHVAFAACTCSALVTLHRGEDAPAPVQIAVFLSLLFSGAMACHGELAARRPQGGAVTSYTLAISLGGAAGGLCAALAPLVFRGYWELHLAVFGAFALLLALSRETLDAPTWKEIRLPAACALALLGIALLHQASTAVEDSIGASRSFYGVVNVIEEHRDDPRRHTRSLLHGQILHGLQLVGAARRREPTAYFGRESGLGLALTRHPRRLAGEPLRVGVLGLGVGTAAAYGEEGDRFTFYELNPDVARLASGAAAPFTFLADSPATSEIVLGDGRLSLERELLQGTPRRFDVLALDAFSSDSVPVHLLTREAFAVYAAHLEGDGILAVNVSNRFVDLRPVVQRQAEELGLSVALVVGHGNGRTTFDGTFMLLTRSRAFLEDAQVARATVRTARIRRIPLWTDGWDDLLDLVW